MEKPLFSDSVLWSMYIHIHLKKNQTAAEYHENLWSHSSVNYARRAKFTISRMLTHTHTHKHIHPYIYAHTHGYVHICIPMHVHTCTHIHIYMCTHMRIYIYTCVGLERSFSS